MSQLSQVSGPQRFLAGPLWEHERPRALRQMMHMPRTVSVLMVGHNRPSPREAKGVCGFRAGAGSSESVVQGDMNHRITPRPTNPSSSSQMKKKISSHLTLLHFLPRGFSPSLFPSCICRQQCDSTGTWLRVWIYFIIQNLIYPFFFFTACLTL